MPNGNSHSCHLRNPETMNLIGKRIREYRGKKYFIQYGIPKHGRGPAKSIDQEYLYPTDTWTATEARAHCAANKGISFSKVLDGRIVNIVEKLKKALGAK